VKKGLIMNNENKINELPTDHYLYNVVKIWNDAYPTQEAQIAFSIGKKRGVTLVSHYMELFGDIFKIRYSRRHGYSGRLKDGRKIRWF
jgi:hypothetical protein